VSDAPSVSPSAYGLFFRRALRVDLDPIQVLPDEVAALDVERVHGSSDAMGDMLLWRRAALFVAFVLQVPPTLVHLVKSFVDLGKTGTGNDIAGLELLVVFANVALVAALWVAFTRWARWSSSRKVLYWAWLVAFTLPFVIALVPYRAVLGAGGAGGAGIGLLAGFGVMVQLGPKVLALLPGLLRSAIVTKVMFPSSPTPGVTVMLGAPFYLLLLFVLLLLPYQLAGGGLMAPALILLMAAPLFMWRAGRALARPRAKDDVVAIVRALKTTTLVTNVLGGLFLLIGLVDVMGDIKLSALDAILPLLQVVANVFTLSIVGVDTLLTALMRAHVAARDDLHQAGLATYTHEMAAFVEAAELAGVSAQPVVVRDPLPPEPMVSKTKPVVPLRPAPHAPAAAPAPPDASEPLGETQPGGPKQ